MTSTYLLTAIATAAVLVSGAAVARHAQSEADQTAPRVAQDSCRDAAHGDRCEDHRQRSHDRHETRVKPVPQVVPNASLPEQASYGWRYFSNPRAVYAVVISPSGEYFLSRGDGPRQITGPAGQDLMTQPEQD